MKRKLFLFLLTAIMTFTLTGCGTKNNATEQDEMVQEPEGLGEEVADDVGNVADDIMGGFRDLLGSATSSEDLYGYMEQNVSGRQPEEVDEMTMGILGYGNDVNAVDFKRLSAHTAFMSDEMSAYVTFMAGEQDQPSVDAEGMHVEMNELLEKCYQMEQHMQTYQNGNTYPYVFDKYCEYMKEAISENYVDQVDEYAAFIEKYPDSRTAALLSDYTKVLLDNNKEVNDEVKAYYDNIQDKFELYINNNGADATENTNTGVTR